MDPTARVQATAPGGRGSRPAGRPSNEVSNRAGTDPYNAILEDVNEVHRRIPREQMRYALDIPYIARENSTAEIRALRKAWARTTG